MPSIGGPPILSRLAVDTGGRFVQSTNDLSLAAAQAQRDLTCRYTLGVYRPGDDAGVAQITVNVLRPGLRALHPAAHRFRSPTEKRTNLLRAAYFSPDFFDTGMVRAHVFPIEPTGHKTWRVQLAVSFPVEIAGPDDGHEFGGVLQRPDLPVHRFSRRVSVQPTAEGPVEAVKTRVTFLEPVELKPGNYTLSAVLHRAGEASPHAEKIEVEVPPVPKRGLSVVGPILGKRAGGNVVISAQEKAGTGDKKKKRRKSRRTFDRLVSDPQDDKVGRGLSYEPLIDHRVAGQDALVALTQVCRTGKKPERISVEASRTLRPTSGEEAVGTLEPRTLVLEGGAAVLCAGIVDLLPVGPLPEGDYRYAVHVFDHGPSPAVERALDFALAD